MRKLLLTIAAATLTMSAFATINVSRKGSGAVTPGIPSQSTQNFGSLKNPSIVGKAGMKKMASKTRAEEGDVDIITEAPQGKLETMLGSSNTFYLYYDEVSMDETYGIAYEGVWTDNR